jgi:hypothetical protein
MQLRGHASKDVRNRDGEGAYDVAETPNHLTAICQVYAVYQEWFRILS